MAEADGIVHRLYKMGVKASEIMKSVPFTKRQIYLRIQKLKKFGNMTPRPKSGRPRKTTPADDRLILLQAERNPFVSGTSIKRDIPDLCCGERTIRNRINESGKLESHFAAKKPFLKPNHIKARLEWARKYKDWTPDQWETVLWSDESIFRLFGNRRKRVWRRPHEIYNQKYIIPTTKSSQKVTVWGCASSKGFGPLYRIEGNLTAKKYVEILENVMLPARQRIFGQTISIFMQDNDPKHSAKITKMYLRDHNIDIMVWPANSPDLNPIENLWAEMKRLISCAKYKNATELWIKAQSLWNNQSQLYFKQTVREMPSRVKEVLHNHGQLTRH